MAKKFHVIVIGAGSTGTATAHDLALRGCDVTVIERGEIASGTTGRNHCLLHSGGLFVAVDESDLAFKESFLAGCEACQIPAREIPVKRALEIEPYLNPKILAAVQVPDGVFEPYRFCLSFLATAMKNGARALPYHEVVAMKMSGRAVVDTRI